MASNFILYANVSLAGQNMLTLQIAIYHEDYGSIIVHLAHNDRQGFQSGQLRSMLTAVPGDNFIAALGLGRAINGESTPYCLTLSTVSLIESSSRTLKGWFLNGNSSPIGICCTCSRCSSCRDSSVEKYHRSCSDWRLRCFSASASTSFVRDL